MHFSYNKITVILREIEVGLDYERMRRQTRQSDVGVSLGSAKFTSGLRQDSVKMRGEERDANATLVTCNIEYSILLAEEEKRHLHCTLGRREPVVFLLTINHYQRVVKIKKWCFPAAVGEGNNIKKMSMVIKTWKK